MYINTQTQPFLEEPLEKRRLEREVSEKETLLIELLEQLEHLKVDLSLIKQEYELKIGRLYLRLDELELEILKFKRIGDLINRGLSFEEARKRVEEDLQKKFDRIREESQRLGEAEEALESEKAISPEEEEELKRLYRKLARKFHPDLGHGDEEIMKKINKTYKEGDLEALRALDQREPSPSPIVPTIEALKTKLLKLERSLDKTNREYAELRKSEWFLIKENMELAQKQGRSFLGELADKILAEIAEKERSLRELKEMYGWR